MKTGKRLTALVLALALLATMAAPGTWTTKAHATELDLTDLTIHQSNPLYHDDDAMDSIGSNAIRLLKFWSTENQVVAAISDPVYDEMCNEALQIADAANFADAMHGLEDYLIEENVYLIPLFEYVNPYLLASSVEGETLHGVYPFFGQCTVTK